MEPKTKELTMPESAIELLDPPAAVDLAPAEVAAQPADVVADDLLVEEISIDGMCGVY
jgi:mycofactocin precursor